MKVLEFIWEYKSQILLLFWLLTYMITSWEKFKSSIKSAMLAAKQMSKEQLLKSGHEQAEWVKNFVYKNLPVTWTAVLGEQRTKELIQNLYNSALDLMDDGKINDSLTDMSEDNNQEK